MQVWDIGEECDWSVSASLAAVQRGAALDPQCCSAACELLPASTPCQDGDACTKDDACYAGICLVSKRSSERASEQAVARLSLTLTLTLSLSISISPLSLNSHSLTHSHTLSVYLLSRRLWRRASTRVRVAATRSAWRRAAARLARACRRTRRAFTPR